jgi:hypothetical protein
MGLSALDAATAGGAPFPANGAGGRSAVAAASRIVKSIVAGAAGGGHAGRAS